MTAAKFQQFAAEQMKTQGADIRLWANDPNPGIAALCQEIIAAAGEGTEKMKKNRDRVPKADRAPCRMKKDNDHWLLCGCAL